MRRSTPCARPYARNSPHAAGRLVALALISNGEIKGSEWATLRELEIQAQLGLTGQQWHDIVDGLCEDLLASAPGGTSCTIDRTMMGRWFDEVDDRALQTRVVQLSAELILADGRIDRGESALLHMAIERWGFSLENSPTPADPPVMGRVYD